MACLISMMTFPNNARAMRFREHALPLVSWTASEIEAIAA